MKPGNLRTKSIINTLLVHHFEIKKRGTVDFKRITPLLHIKRFLGTELHQKLRKTRNYAPVNMVSLYSSSASNARRSVLVNSVRNMVIRTINEESIRGRYFEIYLNQMVALVPQSELQKQLRMALRDLGAQDQKPTKSPLEVVRNFINVPRSWERMVTSHKKSLSMRNYESSNISITFNSLYLLEFNPDQRDNIAKDFALLKLTLMKFNFFNFFVEFESDNVIRGFKCCERLVKSLSFSSPVTLKYLLLTVRHRNLAMINHTVDNLLEVYENYYSTNKQPLRA